MTFAELAARWRDSLGGVAEVADFGEVVEGGRSYALLGASSAAARRAPVVVITAGFHGDEKAGPLTLRGARRRALRVRARARRRAARSTRASTRRASRRTRATTSAASGPTTTSFATRSRPACGAASCTRARRRSRGAPTTAVPKETAALARELARHPAPAAALDLHQDNFIHGAVFYSYVFGDRAPYRPLQARSGALLPVLRSCLVDSGYEPGSDVRADAEGFIEVHDGSITDRFHRAGVPYTAAIETTTETPGPLADEINLIWIRGFIDLAQGNRAPGARGPSDG